MADGTISRTAVQTRRRHATNRFDSRSGSRTGLRSGFKTRFGLGAQNVRRKFVRALVVDGDIWTHRVRRYMCLGGSHARRPGGAIDEHRVLRAQRYAPASCRLLRCDSYRPRLAMIALGLMSGTSLDGVDAA